MTWDLGDWAALYAAIVATGALFMEVRRWFESGPKLNLGVMPEGKLASNAGVAQETYLVVNVSNRGASPTTLTHFSMVHYDSWWRWVLNKPSRSMVVPHPFPPGGGLGLPYLLAPGVSWTGMALHDEELGGLIETGGLWVQIHASHSDRPRSIRVVKRKPPKGKKLGN